jgi:hypothetical protein
VEQYSTDSKNDFLWSLLANPANNARLHAYNLQRLVNDFPQSGILQALFAHASEEKNLKQASVYFNPRSLFKLINAPATFTGVPDEKIVIQPGISGSNGHGQYDIPPIFSEPLNEYHTENIENNNRFHIDSDAPVMETAAETIIHPENQPPVSDTDFDRNNPVVEGRHSADGENEPEIIEPRGDAEAELTAVQHEEAAAVVPGPTVSDFTERAPWEDYETDEEAAPEAALPPVHHQIETVYAEDKEATGADLRNAEIMPPVPEINDEANDEKDEPIVIAEITDTRRPPEIIAETHVNQDTHPVPEIPVDDDIDETFDEIVGIENINFEEPAAEDSFFSFDHEFGAHEDVDEEENDQQEKAAIGGAGLKDGGRGEADHQDVSKYHDEKMPYTFMWWLDKTRKEHALIYQPYIAPTVSPSYKKVKKATDELQQQYFENIFHITTVEELDKNTVPPAVAPDVKRKEQVIIERFIKEEPQIKPQSSDKLDNENKAKKSSEDRDELVTETLAEIYSDQMLYHKAIASYKKLMLKFPEKSRYFAGKIAQLEKKTN